MSEQKDMILENFLSSAIRTLDTDEIYNILMDSLILLLHPQGLLLTQNLNTGRSFCTVRRWGEVFFEKDYSVPSDAFLEEILHQKGLLLAGPLACAAKYSCDQGDPVSAGCNRPFIYR